MALYPSVSTFGKALVESGDLDPIYVMLNEAKLPRQTLHRWCLAYWMFYHAGLASRLAESPNFWAELTPEKMKSLPRGTERRHFRALIATRCVAEFKIKYTSPELAVEWLLADAINHPSPHPFRTLFQRVQQWYAFGPWIAFKVCDMVDAIMGVPVSFKESVPYFFSDPVKGGVIVSYQLELHPDAREAEKLLTDHALRQARVDVALEHMQGAFNNLRAPHADRKLRVQEFETILCKYKSHLNGHYPMGKDTAEILEGLKGCGPLAEHLRKSLARRVRG